MTPLAATFVPVLASVQLDIDVTVVVQFVTFSVFMVALHNLLIKDYLKARDLRVDGTKGAWEDIDEVKANTARLVEEYDEKLRQARREAVEVRESLRNQGVAEQQDISDEVRDELNEKLETQRSKIADMVAEAEAELEERARELADRMVEKILPEA